MKNNFLRTFLRFCQDTMTLWDRYICIIFKKRRIVKKKKKNECHMYIRCTCLDRFMKGVFKSWIACLSTFTINLGDLAKKQWLLNIVYNV